MAENIRPIAGGLGVEITPRAAEADAGSIGAMRGDADLLDAIVEDAMRKRRLQAWRPSPSDFAALESMAEATGRSLYELLDEALHLLPSGGAGNSQA